MADEPRVVNIEALDDEQRQFVQDAIQHTLECPEHRISQANLEMMSYLVLMDGQVKDGEQFMFVISDRDAFLNSLKNAFTELLYLRKLHAASLN